MTRVILVRHGETAWNIEGRFQGTVNVKLNKSGLEQAKALAASLRQEPIDIVYSSPLDRAKQTAEIIATGRGLEVVLEAGFTELNHGRWEGLFLEQVIQDNNSRYQEWLDNPQDFSMPEGENLGQVRKRVTTAFHRILSDPQERTVLIVGHDATNKVLICELLGLGNSHFWKIKQGNGSISMFDCANGRYRLLLLNDTCHLGGVVDTTATGAL